LTDVTVPRRLSAAAGNAAESANAAIHDVEIRSEAGSLLRLISPWTGELIERETKPGEVVALTPAPR